MAWTFAIEAISRELLKAQRRVTVRQVRKELRAQHHAEGRAARYAGRRGRESRSHITKLEGAERKRMLDVFAQSEAIHRLGGFEPTALRKQLDQGVLDSLATNAQIAQEKQVYITAFRTLDGFLESRPWRRAHAGQ